MPRVYTDEAAPYAGEGFDFERYDEIQRNPMVPPQEALQLAHEQELAGEGMNRVYATSQDNAYTVELRQRVMEEAMRKQQAETMARRYKGQRTYQALVEGGATPAEAFRLAGADLNATNPVGEFKDVRGGRILRSGLNSVRYVPDLIPKEVVADKETERRQGRVELGQIGIARQDLQRAKTARDKLEKSDEGRMAAAQAVAAAEVRLRDLEKSYAAPAIAATPEAAPPPPVLETITKAGQEANRGKGGIEMTRQPKAGEAASEAEPVVTTKAEWDALPSGAKYTGKDGRKYRKP